MADSSYSSKCSKSSYHREGTFKVVLTFFLLLILLAAAPKSPQSAPVQPELLALAAEHPDTAVRVIIQKNDAKAHLEEIITQMGGRIINDLPIINAIVAEMEAEQAVNLPLDPSVNWARLDSPIAKSQTSETLLVRDEFNSYTYANNDGLATWASDWQEVGENDGPTEGDLRIYNDQLRIKDDNRSLERAVDLSGAATAELSFDYRRYSLDQSSDYIALELSADGGASWTEIDRFAGPASDSDMQSISYDIVQYASASSMVRFATSSSLSNRDYLYIDNLQIEYMATPADYNSDPGSPPPTNAVTTTIRDDFATVAYNNDDGSLGWENDWIEYDASTPGPQEGLISITNGELSLHDGLVSNPSIAREANLSGVTMATFSFDYRTGSGTEANEDRIAVEISSDGGTTFTVLEIIDNGFASGTKSYDITPYASADTMVRFRVDAAYGGPNEFFAIDHVQIEAEIRPNYYLDTLNVQPVWDKGIQGQGVTIAVIDSGISLETDFGDRILTRAAFNGEAQTTNDVYGHGTHVAGIIGGDGINSFGAYKGVAPQANLIGLKVSDEFGMAYESDTVAAMQWVLDNKDQYNIRVVNLSLNSTVQQSYHTSPMDAAAEILWFNGVVVVASAGNRTLDGNFYTITASPANDPFIITVGASDESQTGDASDDNIALFSAHGTTVDGFPKPDIIAPGFNILSVLSQDANWHVDFPERLGLQGEYFRLSGTSMSAPMVSGAVALLLQAEPNLNPDQVKYRLMNSGSTIDPLWFDAILDQTAYPYLNVYALLTTNTTESANTGLEASQLLWTGDDPITWGSVNWGSVNWGSVNWGSVNWGSVNWGSVNWGSVNWEE